uniref:F-actin binding domain-containing protein n=1 Tax=Bracon brevicornis TaxID=1563983 RepID=A0A6V7I0G1_9HYME
MVHVGALEVQNVKRAINRYGTLPKGARIGAYLESLRQSGMPTAQEAPSVIEQQHQPQPPHHHESQDPAQHRSLSPRQNNLRNQPQMTRSNSSSGVVNTYQPPNSPRSRGMRKNNPENIGLRTFRSPNTSTFRTASPSRSVQPTLADLEFPPPPLDLPPPPNDDHFETNSLNETPRPSNSPVCMRKPKIERRSREDPDEDDKNNDLRTAEPSVKEASSRFGVNLRRREVTTTTNETNKSSDETKKVPFRPTKESTKNDTCILSPPLEAPPPPPPPPPPNNETGDTTFNSKPGMKEMLELKLINEIRQNADAKNIAGTLSKKTNLSSNSIATSAPLDPASQLLSELCASFSMDQANLMKPPIQSEYALTNVKPNIESDYHQPEKPMITKELPSPMTENIVNPGNVGFKLKKVDKRSNPRSEENNTDGQIIDFKARLRKVDNAEKSEEKNRKSEDPSTDASEPDENDDKRRSTGSISSLKRLWENKEVSDNQPLLSPKLGVRSKHDALDPGEESPEDHSGASTRSSATSKSDSRSWHPASTSDASEKPIVPAKPTKPLVTSGKYFTSSIYATPNCDRASHDDDSSKEGKGAKQDVLELSNAIETSITNLKGTPIIVMASWLQLSDKVGLLHGLLQNMTSPETGTVPPHARFQYRDLMSRLELQARQLRAAGTRNITENTRLLSDVQNTIKDVTNMVQR